MRPLLIGLVIVIGFAPRPVGLAQTPAPQAQRVQLTFEPGGLVTLVTNGASLREVLNDWQAKGGTKFNGAERLPATPMTVQFEHRPEAEVMGSLLRSASGVMIAPNTDNPAAASTIGSVFVIPTSNATMSGYTPAPTYQQQPQMSTVGNPEQEIPPAGPGRGNEPPQAAAPPAAKPYGGVAVAVVPVAAVPTAGSTTNPPAGTTPPPTNPPTTTGGRGGGGRGR